MKAKNKGINEGSLLINKQMKVYHWLSEAQFYLVACLYIASRLFVNVSQAYIVFYIDYTLNLSPDMIAIIPLVMYVAGFFISLVLKVATYRVGFKVAFVCSCIAGMGKLLDSYAYIILGFTGLIKFYFELVS